LTVLIAVAAVILIALFFDFVNGFHDTANAIATVVSTRVLTPFQAVLMAAFMNFVGVFIFGVSIALTIGKGIIDPSVVNITIIFAALVGAVIWNLITWYWGLPSSSSHALVGGLIGATIVGVGNLNAIVWDGVLKTFAFIFVAPILGFIGSVFFTIIILSVFKKFSPLKVNSYFRKLQLVSASFYAMGHGTNDAQKTMGLITVLLFSEGLISTFDVPFWVIIAAYGAISIGTFAGGWRIVKTMGSKITKLRPVDGFCAETAGGFVLLGTAHFGIPVSTTHVIAGSIMGTGSVKRGSSVRWIVARKILYAWLFTIPCAAFFAALTLVLTKFAISFL